MTEKEAKVLLQQNIGRFYVYALCYPTGDPFYIGKGKSGGKPERLFQHEKQDKRNPLKLNVIKKIKRNGDNIGYKICNFFDEEEDAFTLEVGLIAKDGRRDNGTGTLTNMTAGGDGSSGYVCTDEMREVQRKNGKKFFEGHPERRKHMSLKTKEWAKNNPVEDAVRRQKAKESLSTDANKEKVSVRMKNWRKSDPIGVAKSIEKLKKTTGEEKYRKEASERGKLWRKNNPDGVLRNETRLREVMAKPETRQKMIDVHKDPVRKAIISEKIKAAHSTPEARKASSVLWKNFYKEHPEARDRLSRQNKEWRKNNPEKIADINRRSAEKHRTEEFRKTTGDRTREWFKNNPKGVVEMKAKIAATRAKKANIRLRCLDFIKEHGLDVVIPNGNGPISSWMGFENELYELAT